jgi:hypothetical protein
VISVFIIFKAFSPNLPFAESEPFDPEGEGCGSLNLITRLVHVLEPQSYIQIRLG